MLMQLQMQPKTPWCGSGSGSGSMLLKDDYSEAAAPFGPRPGPDDEIEDNLDPY